MFWCFCNLFCFVETKPSAEEEDTANPNIYGNQLDKEALINPEEGSAAGSGSGADNSEYLDNEDKPYQENFDYCYRDTDYIESDRDSYLERMSGSHTESYDGGRGNPQGSYLGSYHRIRY